MLTTVLTCFLQVVGPQGPDVVLHLGEGKELVGRVAKETSEAVFLDIGFDILRVPQTNIVRREEVDVDAEADKVVVANDLEDAIPIPNQTIARDKTPARLQLVTYTNRNGQEANQ